jgi:NAD(P)-dependent dehydrogenase (short-subunit alcohol dehydrogenase family)
MNLNNSSSLVTGGASGLGLAVAKMLVQAGSRVAVLDLASPEAEAQVNALGSAAFFCPADVTQPDEVRAALAQVASAGKGLRLAVNCAGVGIAGKILQKGEPADQSIFEKTVAINLFGTFNVCRLAAALIAKNAPNEEGERGVIVNTASIAAYEGQMGQTAYAASKGGIVAMTLPLARDLASYGIRVMTIAPGLFDTPLLSKLPEEVRQSLAASVPFPSRLGRPEEFAALVKHIAENPMLNGEVIRLDGALRMGMK